MLGQIIVSNLTNVSYSINNAGLDEHEIRKKKRLQYNLILKLTVQDAARERHQVRPESLKIF